MKEFSFEEASENIHFGKIKEYFNEVLSSYYNGNYRSSVVMLWSVAICDIIYKLQYLVDLYEDTTALVILKELTEIQNNDPKSSIWEIKLIDDVFTKTQLIGGAEYENLRFLQKQRHLSAHPVLNQNRELHRPNKETVRSLLRNTLEGVLIKPPFYTQKILNELLEDISENSAALHDRKKVKRYVESRYLKRLTPEVELQIYRSLWKLVFKLEDEDCNKNRRINLQLIEVLGRRNISSLNKLIEDEPDYFSNIGSTGIPISFLVFYLSQNHEIYKLLTEDAQLKIRHCIESNEVAKTLGWFIKDSLVYHFEDVLVWIEGDTHPSFDERRWEALLKIRDSEEWQEMFCKLVGSYYACSKNYYEADSRFGRSLELYLQLFNFDAISFTLQRIEMNDQTYGRGRSSFDHSKIKQRALDIDQDFDFQEYPHFTQNFEYEYCEEDS